MHLIFDFDGTIANSFHGAIDKLCLLADQFNFRKIAPHEIDQLRNMSSTDLIKYLQIPLYKLPSIIKQARKEMREGIPHLEPIPELPPILKILHQANLTLGILTSNSTTNVTTWLEYNHLKNLFNFIHSEKNFFGKAAILKKLIKQYRMDINQTFYIGDETRDIEAAKACGITAIAVSWGFNSEAILLQHQPDYLIKEPKDFLKIFRHSHAK